MSRKQAQKDLMNPKNNVENIIRLHSSCIYHMLVNNQDTFATFIALQALNVLRKIVIL